MWLIQKNRKKITWESIIEVARLYFTDATTLISASFVGSILTRGIELFYVDISKEQFATLFLLYNVPKILGSSIQRKLLLSMNKRFIGSSRNFAKIAFVEGLSISLYGIPIYLVSAIVVGMPANQIVFMCGWYFVSSIAITGWIYGKILNFLTEGLSWARKLI